MIKRCLVFATGCAAAWRTNSPAVSRGRMNFILMGLSKLYDGYDRMFITRLTFYYASPVRYMAFELRTVSFNGSIMLETRAPPRNRLFSPPQNVGRVLVRRTDISALPEMR